MHQFVDWLAQTSLSVAIQTHEWVIPTVQSIHIVLIGVVLGSVLMINLRVLRVAGHDQSLGQTTARFGPWLAWALVALLLTGLAMVVGEPARELLAFSFWAKLTLVTLGTAAEIVLVTRFPTKALAVVTLLIWIGVVVLGRLIAYDHVWGSWSAALKD